VVSDVTAFLEVETSARYREAGLDAELDLSHVIHIATANSIDGLRSQMRDRYRVVRIPLADAGASAGSCGAGHARPRGDILRIPERKDFGRHRAGSR
jgi:hypothetical protein